MTFKTCSTELLMLTMLSRTGIRYKKCWADTTWDSVKVCQSCQNPNLWKYDWCKVQKTEECWFISQSKNKIHHTV